MSDEKCPKCGVAGQRDETPDGRVCYLVPEGDDKLLVHYPDGEDCLKRQLAQPPRCWCGKELEPAPGQPGMWNACEACMELVKEGAAQPVEPNERCRQCRNAIWANVVTPLKAAHARDTMELVSLNRQLLQRRADAEEAKRQLAEAGEHIVGLQRQLADLHAVFDQSRHDWKQLRQAMDCDGSDLPQLLAAWDKLQAARVKADLEVERLRGELNPPFSHRADCEGPAMAVLCMNCEQAKFKEQDAENERLRAILGTARYADWWGVFVLGSKQPNKPIALFEYSDLAGHWAERHYKGRHAIHRMRDVNLEAAQAAENPT